jgi:hypothetical protein
LLSAPTTRRMTGWLPLAVELAVRQDAPDRRHVTGAVEQGA